MAYVITGTTTPVEKNGDGFVIAGTNVRVAKARVSDGSGNPVDGVKAPKDKGSLWIQIFAVVISLAALGYVVWTNWQIDQMQENLLGQTASCRAVSFTIPQYDAVLRRTGFPGAKIRITLQRNASSERVGKFFYDLAVCNSDNNNIVQSPNGRVGFADVQVGYLQNVGATVWVPSGETFRFSFRDNVYGIAPIAKFVEPTQTHVVFN